MAATEPSSPAGDQYRRASSRDGAVAPAEQVPNAPAASSSLGDVEIRVGSVYLVATAIRRDDVASRSGHTSPWLPGVRPAVSSNIHGGVLECRGIWLVSRPFTIGVHHDAPAVHFERLDFEGAKHIRESGSQLGYESSLSRVDAGLPKRSSVGDRPESVKLCRVRLEHEPQSHDSLFDANNDYTSRKGKPIAAERGEVKPSAAARHPHTKASAAPGRWKPATAFRK